MLSSQILQNLTVFSEFTFMLAKYPIECGAEPVPSIKAIYKRELFCANKGCTIETPGATWSEHNVQHLRGLYRILTLKTWKLKNPGRGLKS
jgi:hypothetical protein